MGDQPIHFPTKQEKMRNMFNATVGVVQEAPSKIYEEIANDLQNPTKLATVGVTSTAAGFGTTALLKKCPKVGGTLLAGMAAYQAFRYGAETIGFLGEASHADSDFKQELLIQKASSSIGKEAAVLVESAPGFALGGGIACKTFGTPPLYEAIGSRLDRSLITPMKKVPNATREFFNEKWAFNAPGGMRVPAHIRTQEGHINVLELSEMLAPKHKWTGVETGRSIDLLDLRITKRLTSEQADRVLFGFQDKPGRIPFHTHGPDNPMGPRPGRPDLLSTLDLGIIQRGPQTSFFVGQRRQYQHALANGVEPQAFAPRMQSLVLDADKQTALILDTLWHPTSQSWQTAVPKYVDYQAARRALTKLDITKPWQQFEQIPVIPRMRAQTLDIEPLLWLRTQHFAELP